MSRFILSNSRNSLEKILNHFSNQCYEVDFSIPDNDFYITGLKTKNKETYYKQFNNDWVFIGGTFITIPEISSPADFIYNNFNEDVNFIRRAIFGSYCICIKKDGISYIFVDDFSIYKVYFFHDKNTFVVSNTLFSISKTSKHLTVNENALLELCFQHSSLDDQTIFNEIKQIKADKLLKYNIEEKRLNVVQIPKHSPKDRIKITADKLAEELKYYSSLISKKFSRITLNMTGGLDSRLILSSFLSIGCKPLLIYGNGSSPLTNTKEEDLEIVRLISEKFGLKMYIMDWSYDISGIQNENTEKSLLYKYDEYFRLYGANPTILNEYSEQITKKSDFIEYGYFGEMLRNLPWLESYKRAKIPFSLLVKKYLNDDLSGFSDKSSSYKLYMSNKIRSTLFHTSISDENDQIDKDDFQKFHAMYRYSADTFMNNFSNSGNNSIILQGMPAFHNKVLEIPFSEKTDSSIQLKLINALYPELLEVPFFSHTKKWAIDKYEFKLRPLENESFIYQSLKNRLSHYGTIRKIYKTISRTLSFDKNKRDDLNKSQILKTIYVSKINDLQNKIKLNLINPSKYHGDIRILVRYYHLLLIVKESSSTKSNIKS